MSQWQGALITIMQGLGWTHFVCLAILACRLFWFTCCFLYQGQQPLWTPPRLLVFFAAGSFFRSWPDSSTGVQAVGRPLVYSPNLPGVISTSFMRGLAIGQSILSICEAETMGLGATWWGAKSSPASANFSSPSSIGSRANQSRTMHHIQSLTNIPLIYPPLTINSSTIIHHSVTGNQPPITTRQHHQLHRPQDGDKCRDSCSPRKFPDDQRLLGACSSVLPGKVEHVELCCAWEKQLPSKTLAVHVFFSLEDFEWQVYFYWNY